MSCFGPSCRQLLVPIAQQKPLALARGFPVPSRCPGSAADLLILYIYYIYNHIQFLRWSSNLYPQSGGLPSVDSALGSSDLDVRKRRCVHSTCVLWGEIDFAALLLNRVFFIAT